MLGMTIEATISESRVEALCALAEQTRELMDAVAMTGVGEQELAAVTAELRALTERLDAAGRTSAHPFEIRPDGTVRTLGNAVIGAANPFAFPLVSSRSGRGAYGRRWRSGRCTRARPAACTAGSAPWCSTTCWARRWPWPGSRA